MVERLGGMICWTTPEGITYWGHTLKVIFGSIHKETGDGQEWMQVTCFDPSVELKSAGFMALEEDTEQDNAKQRAIKCIQDEIHIPDAFLKVLIFKAVCKLNEDQKKLTTLYTMEAASRRMFFNDHYTDGDADLNVGTQVTFKSEFGQIVFEAKSKIIQNKGYACIRDLNCCVCHMETHVQNHMDAIGDVMDEIYEQTAEEFFKDSPMFRL